MNVLHFRIMFAWKKGISISNNSNSIIKSFWKSSCTENKFPWKFSVILFFILFSLWTTNVWIITKEIILIFIRILIKKIILIFMEILISIRILNTPLCIQISFQKDFSTGFLVNYQSWQAHWQSWCALRADIYMTSVARLDKTRACANVSIILSDVFCQFYDNRVYMRNIDRFLKKIVGEKSLWNE